MSERCSPSLARLAGRSTDETINLPLLTLRMVGTAAVQFWRWAKPAPPPPTIAGSISRMQHGVGKDHMFLAEEKHKRTSIHPLPSLGSRTAEAFFHFLCHGIEWLRLDPPESGMDLQSRFCAKRNTAPTQAKGEENQFQWRSSPGR